MDNGNFQMPAGSPYPGPYTTRAYEPLKEEMEVFPRGPTSTVVNVTTYQTPTSDHIVWSIFNTMYMNFCCLGFIALAFSVKARDRKLVGDMSGAASYGSTAKGLNIAALVLSLLFIILIIVLLATGAIALIPLMQQQQSKFFDGK